MWPALAAIGGPALGVLGGEQTNRSNETIAKDTTAANMQEGARNRAFQSREARSANAFTAKQVAQQMDFQERMSNTAHQREMSDLAAAGLNPLLTATGGAGASSPTGASGQGQSGSGSQASAVAAKVENPYAQMSAFVNSAFDSLKLLGDLDLQKGQIAQQGAQTALIKAQTHKSGIDAKAAEKDIPRSDLLNRGYKILEPVLKKVEDWSKNSSKKKTPLPRGFINTKPRIP